MNQRDELLIKYTRDLKEKFNVTPDAGLLKKIAIGLGPSIYNRDSGTVSSSDEKELERLKSNYLIKKLGLDPNRDLDSPLNKILNTYGKTHRLKYRVVVYYLLVKHFNKEDCY